MRGFRIAIPASQIDRARGFYEHLCAESDERTVWRWLPEAMARFTASG